MDRLGMNCLEISLEPEFHLLAKEEDLLLVNFILKREIEIQLVEIQFSGNCVTVNRHTNGSFGNELFRNFFRNQNSIYLQKKRIYY